MKKPIFTLIYCAIALTIMAQHNAPAGFNWQGKFWQGKELLADKTMDVIFTIVEDPDGCDGIGAGTIVYRELHHNIKTNQFGLLHLLLGEGIVEDGAWTDLEWGRRCYFQQVSAIVDGEQMALGMSKIMAVPFTNYAPGSTNWVNIGDTVLYHLIGNVGIGTDTANSPLTVKSAIPDNGLRITAEDKQTEIRLHVSGSDYGYFNLGGNTVMRGGTNKSSFGGQLGIGKIPFGAMLDIQQGETTQRVIVLRAADSSKDIWIESYTEKEQKMWTINMGDRNQNNRFGLINAEGNHVLTVAQDGRTLIKVLEILGNDRAELHLTATGEQLPHGSVVVFDEQQPGRVRLSDDPYDQKRAGVITQSTGKYRTGILHAQEEMRAGQPVALDGTIEVLAIGPITVGDDLTTSRLPGYAMKAKNRKRATGAVIGKALQNLEAGEQGIISMRVELR